MCRIIWLSRHAPTANQRAELERLFPGHTLRIDSRGWANADDIVARFRASRADELVLVAPLWVIHAVIKRGIEPLWAEMESVPPNSPLAEVQLKQGRCYAFKRFHRMHSIRLDSTPLLEPQAKTPSQTLVPHESPTNAPLTKV